MNIARLVETPENQKPNQRGSMIESLCSDFEDYKWPSGFRPESDRSEPRIDTVKLSWYLSKWDKDTHLITTVASIEYAQVVVQ